MRAFLLADLADLAISALLCSPAYAAPRPVNDHEFLSANPNTKRQFDAQELLDAFTTGLETSNYDMSTFDGNVSDLASRLVGWEGCSGKGVSAAVYSGWQQSWKLMNHVYSEAKKGIDFNSAAAIEFIGPPALSQPFQKSINDKSPRQLEMLFVN